MTDGGQISYAEAFAVLQQKSRSELDTLMNDNDTFNSLVDGLAMVKQLATDKDALMISNASLADYNLSLEPRLISSREDLAEKYRTMVELQKRCEGLMLKVESSAVNTSPETTLALLQTELAKVEEDSEKLAEDFSSAGRATDVDSFVSQYVSLRTLAHLRRVKVEKLTELLNGRGARNHHESMSSAHLTSAPVGGSVAPPAIPPRPVPVSVQPPPFYPSGPPGPVNPGWAPQSQQYPPVVGANGWAPYTAYNSPVPRGFPPPPVASYMPH